MRLLEAATLQLVEFDPGEIPRYAILSHTWEAGEVLFEDIVRGTGSTKPGYRKVQLTGEQAIPDGLHYSWVDSCCINKDSSAELSESLNSMFVWYQKAEICYAYLSDVDNLEDLRSSRWFTRGWTLQELLAPADVLFYARDWVLLGSKRGLRDIISEITGIGIEYLCGYRELECASIAQRMFWAANRQTRRPEDIAYCLLGIFGVNMPMLYGEGSRAFIRLQEEIMRRSDDQSLFAWFDPSAPSDALYGLLATSPALFSGCGSTLSYENWEAVPPYTMTNRGLRIELPIQVARNDQRLDVAALNCPVPNVHHDNTFIGIYVQKLASGDDQYARAKANRLCRLTNDRGSLQTLYVRQPMAAGISRVFSERWAGPYRVISTLPPGEPTSDLFNPAPTHAMGPEPSFLSQLRRSHLWAAPSRCRYIFPVPKAKKQLAGAILLQYRRTNSYICIMVGSITEYNVGFSAIDTEICDFHSVAPARTMDLSDLQADFDPIPLGKWIRLQQVQVRISTTVHVFNEGKYFTIQPELAEMDGAPRDSESVHGNHARNRA
ncbi:heterokaryon incompatibility protein-domain-containing protein [Aspergillus egyptiacus]|nr:heterokaryon incompatibility protein-domain-containing protein [Aspergillus egyptiacus]